MRPIWRINMALLSTFEKIVGKERIMKIMKTANGFEQLFEQHSVVEKLQCDYKDGTCTIKFRNNTVKKIFANCTVFNEQYGIPISEDGSKIYINSWEKGLTAYDTKDGRILWKTNIKSLSKVFVFQEFIIALKSGSCIIKINDENGSVIDQIKGSSIEDIYNLQYYFFLIISWKKNLCVVDTSTMSVIKNYSLSIANPNKCLSFVIQTAKLKKGYLVIEGFEEFPNMNFSNKGVKFFSRVIDCNCVI